MIVLKSDATPSYLGSLFVVVPLAVNVIERAGGSRCLLYHIPRYPRVPLCLQPLIGSAAHFAQNFYGASVKGGVNSLNLA